MPINKRKPGQKSTSFGRLKGLGVERLTAIEQNMLKGYSPERVAEMIQDEWGEFQDVKRATLAKQIRRYRDSEMEKQMAVFAEDMDPERREAALALIKEDINVMEELSALVNVQRKRLDKALEMEAKMPTTFGWLKNEIRLMKDTLNDLAKLQLETGVLQRVDRNFNANISLHEIREHQLLTLSEDRQRNDEVVDVTNSVLKELGIITEGEVVEDDYGYSDSRQDT